MTTAENFRWIKGNFKQTGYYRVNYDAENWKNLQHQLNEKHKVIKSILMTGITFFLLWYNIPPFTNHCLFRNYLSSHILSYTIMYI